MGEGLGDVYIFSEAWLHPDSGREWNQRPLSEQQPSISGGHKPGSLLGPEEQGCSDEIGFLTGWVGNREHLTFLSSLQGYSGEILRQLQAFFFY